MPLPAFSNIPLAGSNATLLWSSYHNNTTSFATPDNTPTIYYYTGDITGVDSNSSGVATLESAFGVTGDYYAAYIMDDILVDHPLSDIFVTTVRASTFPGGIGNEVEVNQVARHDTEWVGSRPQMEFNIVLDDNISSINEFYATKMIEIPSNLDDILDRSGSGWTAAWMEIEAVKCGLAVDNDMRISIQIQQLFGETGFRVRAQLDNCGTDTVTGVTNGVIAGLNADKIIDYGQTDEGSIIPGEKYKFEYWIKRSAGRDDLTTGRFVVVMTRLSTGARTTVTNKTGGQFWGYHSYHFTRFFPVVVYSGGFPASGNITLKFSNIEYWAKPPYIMI